jgi:hypothetical protein
MPCRIQLQRRKGWRLPAHTICVTRPSRWGNPFNLERFDLETALWLFVVYAHQRLTVEPDWLTLLRGKDLACWCAEDAACHADILLEMANRS